MSANGGWPGARACALGLWLGLSLLGCPEPSGRVRGQPALVAPVPAPEPSAWLLENERNTIEVFERVSESVVFVTNTRLIRNVFTLDVTKVRRGTGSGFVWDEQGHIVTNFHVLQGGNAFSVTLPDGSALDAKVVGFDPRKDLAVLRAEDTEKLRPVELGSSSDLRVGQKVLAIGSPFGLDRTLTTGVISALGREIPDGTGGVIEGVIQTDASINPGNSGGPLLDSQGRLIGINTAIYSPSGASAGIGFSVPVDDIRRVVPQLIRFGKVKRAGLGVTVLPDHLTRRWGLSGVAVRRVQPGSAAARAGLKSIQLDRRGRVVGLDVITGIDDAPVNSIADLDEAFEDLEPGAKVALQFRRGEDEIEAVVELQALD